MDPEALYRKLEFASFSQREQIADEVVRDVPAESIGPLVRGLEHPHENVRLGVIEILRRASYRESLRKLLQHARSFEGDERVFAMRAIADLVQPGDDFLLESVKGWLRWGDPFVTVHATKIKSVLEAKRTAAKAARAEALPSGESLEQLVIKLFSAKKGPERIALVEAIERRGPQALFAAAKLTFQKGNADLVPHMCRAVIRQATSLQSPEILITALEATRKRLGDQPIANAAIDDALIALGGVTLSPALLSRLHDIDKSQLDALVARFVERPPNEIALLVPKLLDAIARKPALWSSLGPALVYAAAHVRESTRAELRRLTELVLDDLRAGKALPPVTVVSACWVLSHVAKRGEPLSRHLRMAIDRLAVVEAARALCELCLRLSTEEAAVVAIAMVRDPLPEARAAARDVLHGWQSTWIRIENVDGDPSIVPRYQDEKGQPLERRGDRLVASGGDEYVLDASGRPVRGGGTESGGCLCCSPQRALVRRRGDGLRCPSTWESHLRDAERTMLERDDALGRCKRCDSPRPRVRDGVRIVCVDCGSGIASDSGSAPGGEPQPHPQIPSEHGRRDHEDAFPKPPTRDELEEVTPVIRSAIMANVFLRSKDGAETWNGSGIIIARDGNHIAILTNRHVVESDDGHRLCAMKAMVVSGETITVKAVWRAKRGVDLALVEGRIERPDSLGVMPLGTGMAVVGDEVFAIGNPLGLAWSYSKGTLSAIRHWTTQDGLSVKVMQTDTNTAPGSSGGGLFHGEGHLVGVVSFGRSASSGGSAHFALSVPAIREAFSREGVRWRGQALAELPL